MVHVIVIDEESGEIWTGVQDGSARPLFICPDPEDGAVEGLDIPRGKPAPAEREH
jgi:hypothetical protein